MMTVVTSPLSETIKDQVLEDFPPLNPDKPAPGSLNTIYWGLFSKYEVSLKNFLKNVLSEKYFNFA